LIGLFGGVYSNHLALEAVLDDAGRRGIERAICLGDVGGSGPRPDRSIEILRARGVETVQGNYDDSVGHAREDCACGYTDPRDEAYASIAYAYTLANTSEPGRAWLRSLPASIRFEHAGRSVLLCHGSPRQTNEFLWESRSPDAFLERLAADSGADVVAVTHTGIPWVRRLPSGRLFVNVGAIGRPPNDGDPSVPYAILSADDVRIVRVGYDHERMAGEIAQVGLPAEFAESLRTGWWTTCVECLPAKERALGRW
jgi:diadenosine tetraphosphatase ApaH/serine/threonine PP2A family protein phosphatase